MKTESQKYFAIIGSSNITRPAFGSTSNPTFNLRTFNRECDVIMWSDGEPWSSAVSSFIVDTCNDSEAARNSVIMTNGYDESGNFNISFEDRIQNLEGDILSSCVQINID